MINVTQSHMTEKQVLRIVTGTAEVEKSYCVDSFDEIGSVLKGRTPESVEGQNCCRPEPQLFHPTIPNSTCSTLRIVEVTERRKRY